MCASLLLACCKCDDENGLKKNKIFGVGMLECVCVVVCVRVFVSFCVYAFCIYVSVRECVCRRLCFELEI